MYILTNTKRNILYFPLVFLFFYLYVGHILLSSFHLNSKLSYYHVLNNPLYFEMSTLSCSHSHMCRPLPGLSDLLLDSINFHCMSVLF